MRPMLMLLKTDGSGSHRSYLLEYRGQTLLPLFDNAKDVQEFMEYRNLDPEEYRVSETTYGFIEKIAQEAKESGIERYTFGPSSREEDPVMFAPIDSLIGQARIMQGKT